MEEEIKKNILSTVVYYDVLDYPLTSFEIWKYLVNGEYGAPKTKEDKKRKYSLPEIVFALENGDINKYIEKYQGFYFLKGRKGLVEKRIERNKISEKKFKIIKRAVFWLRICPFLKMIGVTGRVAMKNADQESDLDFLVIFKKNRIFTGRLLFTFLTHVLGRRRYGGKITDRICLNYFLTEKDLKIRTEDFFSASEYSFIFPIFGQKTFCRFQRKNSWIRNFKPNYSLDLLRNLKISEDSEATFFFRKKGEKILGWNFLEKKLGKWQKRRIERDPRTKRAGSLIVADDEALVFLPEPQGPEIYEKFTKKKQLLTLG